MVHGVAGWEGRWVWSWTVRIGAFVSQSGWRPLIPERASSGMSLTGPIWMSVSVIPCTHGTLLLIEASLSAQTWFTFSRAAVILDEVAPPLDWDLNLKGKLGLQLLPDTSKGGQRRKISSCISAPRPVEFEHAVARRAFTVHNLLPRVPHLLAFSANECVCLVSNSSNQRSTHRPWSIQILQCCSSIFAHIKAFLRHLFRESYPRNQSYHESRVYGPFTGHANARARGFHCQPKQQQHCNRTQSADMNI